MNSEQLPSLGHTSRDMVANLAKGTTGMVADRWSTGGGGCREYHSEPAG